MHARIQLVYFGEVLAGFERDDVQRRLGRALKLDERHAARLFSGKRKVLKRALERQMTRLVEAPRDLRRLERVAEMAHMLEGALRTHPTAFVGHQLRTNHFFEPPDVFFDRLSPRERVEWKLQQLTR